MWLERSTTMEKMEKLALLGGTPVRATLLPYAHHTIEADDIAAVTETLASDWITQGPAIVRFEKALAARGGPRPVGALADMTTLSFHPAKLITTGEGGGVLTDRDDLAERLRTMRHHGIRYPDSARPWRYEIDVPGNNYRLTDFQAALGLSQLGKLERFWERRDKLARRYRQRLAASPFVELPALPVDRRHGWHLFLVLLRLDRLSADRGTILRALPAENIGASLHYALVYP